MSCLESSPSMDDGLDEDAQVLTRLPGLVAFQTETKPGRPRIAYRNLVHQVLSTVLRQGQDRRLSFLTCGKKKKTIVFIRGRRPENN